MDKHNCPKHEALLTGSSPHPQAHALVGDATWFPFLSPHRVRKNQQAFKPGGTKANKLERPTREAKTMTETELLNVLKEVVVAASNTKDPMLASELSAMRANLDQTVTPDTPLASF